MLINAYKCLNSLKLSPPSQLLSWSLLGIALFCSIYMIKLTLLFISLWQDEFLGQAFSQHRSLYSQALLMSASLSHHPLLPKSLTKEAVQEPLYRANLCFSSELEVLAVVSAGISWVIISCIDSGAGTAVMVRWLPQSCIFQHTCYWILLNRCGDVLPEKAVSFFTLCEYGGKQKDAHKKTISFRVQIAGKEYRWSVSTCHRVLFWVYLLALAGKSDASVLLGSWKIPIE